MEGLGLYGVFAAMFFTTWLTRGAFLLAGERVRLPASMQRFLRFAPAAALGALIAPELVGGTGQPLDFFSPRLAAAVAVTLVVLRWRNPWLPFFVGMGVLLALQHLGG